MYKTISIEQLAEKLNGNLWIKGNIKRIYLSNAGWNTKKMSTKAYVFLKQDGRYGVSCTVECPSQPAAWIASQEQEVTSRYEARIAEIIEESGIETEDPRIAIEAELAAEEQVQGYYIRWHEVRVAINSYGKLGIRKRQQVHTYKGAISRTPEGFIALSDDDYAIAISLERKGTTYGYDCEPNLVGEANRARERKSAQEERESAYQEELEAKKVKEEQTKIQAAKELAEKMDVLKSQGFTDPVLAWKQLGCPHPAPAEVVEAKNASGLNWKQFTLFIK